MLVECEQFQAPSTSATDKPVKDRLALSALCNNSSAHQCHNSYSSRTTSPGGSGFSQNQSSSSISLRGKPLSPPSFLEAGDAPDFFTSHRLPPISDLKLFGLHQCSIPEVMVAGNSSQSDGIRIPIQSQAPHQLVRHDNHPHAPQIVRRKPCMTSAPTLSKMHSNSPSFSPSPPAFSQASSPKGNPTNSPLPDVKPLAFARRKWSPLKDTHLPTSLSPSLSVSHANSSYTRRGHPSQSTSRVCTNCGVLQTRQWVRGENHSWLCHSCGQFWRKNGCSRPRALWNRPTFKRSSRKSKLRSDSVEDSKKGKGSTKQTVSSSFLDGKKMIQLETCLPSLHGGSDPHKALSVLDGLTTR